MRVWLARDPRVIRMADHIARQRGFMDWLTDPVHKTCDRTAHEHVTRNVTVALCVTGLLVTWGSAREQGDRENDDLVLAHTDLSTLDAMTDMPSFGASMCAVGWAVERDDGYLVFPKFFKENESPDEKHKRQNAKRQATFRSKRNADVTPEVTPVSNVTVTHREEKSREEIKPESKPKPRREPPAAFAPPDWIPAESWEKWRRHRGRKLTPDAITLQVKKLDDLRASGYEPAAMIDLAIESSWATFYPPRAQGPPNGTNRAPTLAEKRAANMDAICGRGNGRVIDSERVGGAVVRPTGGDLRQQDDGDVGRLPEG